MKLPCNREEFLVWPPMGGVIALIVLGTLHITLPIYQALLCEYDGAPFYTGYIFPILMGIALAWRLHGKFWLGFAWTGFIFYICALLITLLPSSTVLTNMFMVSMCLAILLAVESSWLGMKRAIQLQQEVL